MKILFLGQKDCIYSGYAIEYLEKLGHDITSIPSSRRNEKIPEEIMSWHGDYILTFYSYFIIPQKLIDQAKVCINFHPSSPEHAGSGMINWALYNDHDQFGVTAHLIQQKIDSGKILRVNRFKILAKDDIKSVAARAKVYCMNLFYELMQELLLEGVSIDTLLEKNSHERWECEPRKISQVDKMSEIYPNIEGAELERRVRAFHTKEYPLSISIHGRKFTLG